MKIHFPPDSTSDEKANIHEIIHVDYILLVRFDDISGDFGRATVRNFTRCTPER